MEEDGVIPFLDTKIHRHTSGFSFVIYRKPTHSGQYVHYFCCQPDHVKRGAAFSLFLRAYRICDYPHLLPELEYLYKAFGCVGFPKHVLEEVHSAVKRKHYQARADEREVEQVPTISLPHTSFVANYVKPLLHANNCRVVCGASNTIKQMLISNKQAPVDSDRRGVVYRVPCAGCNKNYFGETGRGLSVRLSEHRRDVRLGRINNACFKHVRDTNHSINWEGAEILYKSEDLCQRLVVESTCIQKHPNFNNMASTLTIENLSANVIFKAFPNLANFDAND